MKIIENMERTSGEGEAGREWGNKLELNEDGVGGIVWSGQGGYGEKW